MNPRYNVAVDFDESLGTAKLLPYLEFEDTAAQEY